MEKWHEHFNEAAMAVNTGEYESAVNNATLCVEAGCTEIDIYSIRGMSYFYLGKYKECVEDLTVFLNEINLDYEIRMNRGLAYKNLGNDQKALDDYNQSLKEAPNYGNCFLNRGYLYYSQKNYPAAISDFINAEKYGSATEDMYWRRAVAYYNSEDKDNSYKDLNSAARLDPERASTHALMGKIEFDKKEYEKAINCLSRAIYLDENDVESYDSRMMAYYYIKKYRESIADGNHLLKLFPERFKAGKNTDDLKTILQFGVNEDNEMVCYILDEDTVYEYPFIL
jgi:tetratricopeptide (TPR) repeat protein